MMIHSAVSRRRLHRNLFKYNVSESIRCKTRETRRDEVKKKNKKLKTNISIDIDNGVSVCPTRLVMASICEKEIK